MELRLVFDLGGRDEFAGDFDFGAVVQEKGESSVGAVAHVEPVEIGDFLFVNGGGDELGDDGIHIVVWSCDVKPCRKSVKLILRRVFKNVLDQGCVFGGEVFIPHRRAGSGLFLRERGSVFVLVERAV